MRNLNQTLKRLARDSSGGEVIEYAIILGLIAVAAISLIAAVGVKVLARWNTANGDL